MSWAGRRRFIITAIGAVVIIAAIALTLIATFYQAPSCADTVQNQGEQGIDCGGPCANLCTALEQALVVRFTKAIISAPNRVDVIAYVDNPNVSAAARNVPYTVTLYAADHTVLKTSKGTLDLPPSHSVPVFIPAFFTGNVSGTQVFLTINPIDVTWFTYASAIRVPTVANPSLAGTNNAPRVTATLSNPGTSPFSNVKVIVVVYDSADNVTGASQTLIPTISGQSSAVATFTWGQAFPGTPARIEVTPVPALSP